MIYRGHPVAGAGLVAIKQLTIADDPSQHAENLRHFEREYKILCGLKHPCLPLVLDFFEENGIHYLVEEYVPGETLQTRLEREERVPWPRAVAIALHLLDALAYLHRHHIIHRDLKPGNILLTRSETPRLIDFGTARNWKPGASADTVPLGTPGYASPEQYGRAQTDARSDVYSVGVVLHHMLTGHDPTEREPWKFAVPASVDAACPEFLSQTVMTALALDPARRFLSAQSMHAALLGVEPSSGGAQGPLATFRLRLQYTEPSEYFTHRTFEEERLRWPAWMGLFSGVTPLSLITIPCIVFAVGFRMVGAYASAHARWQRYRNLVVELYEEGLFVFHARAMEICWDDITRLQVQYKPGRASPTSAHIWTRTDFLLLDGEWPGIYTVVQSVLQHTSLTEEHPHDPTAHLHQRTYVR